MLAHVLDAVATLHPQVAPCVVIGHGAEQVKDFLDTHYPQVKTAIQAEQKGTGHAVAQAMGSIAPEDVTLILYGDVPLIRAQTLVRLTTLASDGALSLLPQHLDNPTGYGRIVRDAQEQIIRIVEEKDADPSIRLITEINTGVMAVPTVDLARWLKQLEPNNAQGEYYLTDIISMAVS